jgi:hypothetical protein
MYWKRALPGITKQPNGGPGKDFYMQELYIFLGSLCTSKYLAGLSTYPTLRGSVYK